METPLLYAPQDIPILNSHELPDVKVALSSGINELERIRHHLLTSQKILDVDTVTCEKHGTASNKCFALGCDNRPQLFAMLILKRVT
jgi:hypothetical protein